MAAAVSVEAVASPANEFDDNDSSEQDLRSSVSTALAGDEELDEEEVDVIDHRIHKTDPSPIVNYNHGFAGLLYRDLFHHLRVSQITVLLFFFFIFSYVWN